LDADAYLKKREDQLGRAKRDLRTRFAQFIEVDCRIPENLL